MVPEELKLMDSESGTANRTIQGIVEMVAAMTKEELCKMTAEKRDAFKMMSTMAEAPMTTETREVALKMVAEAPKKLETEAGELNLMERRHGKKEGGVSDLVIAYAVAEGTK